MIKKSIDEIQNTSIFFTKIKSIVYVFQVIKYNKFLQNHFSDIYKNRLFSR